MLEQETSRDSEKSSPSWLAQEDTDTTQMDKTNVVGQTWGRVGLDEQRILLDWWVLDVMLVVEPIPGKKRANRKSAVVTCGVHRTHQDMSTSGIS